MGNFMLKYWAQIALLITITTPGIGYIGKVILDSQYSKGVSDTTIEWNKKIDEKRDEYNKILTDNIILSAELDVCKSTRNQ
jgi:hypothetical protein